ncbi:hypothetical protein MASR2M18_17370 [Ignavibacteria bacterium]|nr:outer membrane beta-barrel protein [Bacteroidota bacterium]MCZ2132006.1 outer membrane beta-barrel protein [Bacteroidota bacterium]
MKFLIFVFCAMTIIAAQAQEAAWPKLKTFVFQAEAGLIAPRNLDYAYRAGISLGGGLGLRFGRGISLIANVRYSGIPHDETAAGNIAIHPDSISPKIHTESDFTFRQTEITLEGQYRFQYNPREPSAYIAGGINYISVYRQKLAASLTESATLTELGEHTDSSYGYNIGLGLDWPIQRDRTSIFGEILFSKGVIQIDGSNINPYFLHFLAGARVNL